MDEMDVKCDGTMTLSPNSLPANKVFVVTVYTQQMYDVWSAYKQAYNCEYILNLYGTYVPGDVNGDGDVTSADVTALYGVLLSDENHRQLFVPRGFAHGFYVVSPTAVFAYKCDDVYHPNDEGGLMWNDPLLAVDWQSVAPGLKPLSKLSQLATVPKTFRCDLPFALSEELRRCKSDDEVKQVGIEWGIAQCRDLIAHGIPSLHFYTLSAVDSIRQIAEAIY